MGVNGGVVAIIRRTIYTVIKGGLISRVRFVKIMELIVRGRNQRHPEIAAGREHWRNSLFNRREF